MAWDEKMKAWASGKPKKKPGDVGLEVEKTLKDGRACTEQLRISQRGMKLILLALRIAQHI